MVAVADPEFLHGAVEVGFDGAYGEDESVGYVGVGEPARREGD